MKKILFLLFCILLVSCGQSDEEILGINTSKVEDTKEEQSSTLSGTVSEDVNSEIEVEESVPKNNKELIMKNHNVFLSEPGKEDIILTTRGKGYYSCEESNLQEFYSYEILQSEGNYGIVKKIWNTCEGVGGDSFYGINLNNNTNANSEMIDISSSLGDFVGSPWYGDTKTTALGNSLKIERTADTVVKLESEEQMGLISEETLKKEGFVLKGDTWEKILDLKALLPDIQETQINESQTTSNLPDKYLPQKLISEGYKVNKLGNITEYYKKEKTPDTYYSDSRGGESLSYVGSTCYKTVYTQGDKFLDFAICDANGMNGVDIYVYSDSPQDKYLFYDSLQNYFDYWDANNYPLQPIFGSDVSKVVITDLNTIKLVNSQKNISKTIWTR